MTSGAAVVVNEEARRREMRPLLTFSSQLRAEKAKGLEVRAPTGQRSMMLPLISLVRSLVTKVPIYIDREWGKG